MFTLEELTEAKVIEETNKLLYLYTLKHVIRFGDKRSESDFSESVGEHVFGMHVVADYFLPLEDLTGELDRAKIYKLITWHELDEIETGDVPAMHKTDADRLEAAKMLLVTLRKLPSHIQDEIKETSNEYEAQETAEAQFVKAIDKLEPLIHSFDPKSKTNQHNLKMTVDISQAVKEPYIQQYPYIKKFSDLLHNVMEREGYFYHPE